MKRFAFIALIVLAASCSAKVSEEFLLSEVLCLEVGGEEIFSYDASLCQTACNPEKYSFRVMDDTMSKYYMLTCSEMPSAAGQKISADLRWVAGEQSGDLSDVEFKVEKVEGDKVWLWSSRRKIAVSVRIIRN